VPPAHAIFIIWRSNGIWTYLIHTFVPSSLLPGWNDSFYFSVEHFIFPLARSFKYPQLLRKRRKRPAVRLRDHSPWGVFINFEIWNFEKKGSRNLETSVVSLLYVNGVFETFTFSISNRGNDAKLIKHVQLSILLRFDEYQRSIIIMLLVVAAGQFIGFLFGSEGYSIHNETITKWLKMILCSAILGLIPQKHFEHSCLTSFFWDGLFLCKTSTFCLSCRAYMAANVRRRR
jgi:hypothetical protein